MNITVLEGSQEFKENCKASLFWSERIENEIVHNIWNGQCNASWLKLSQVMYDVIKFWNEKKQVCELHFGILPILADNLIFCKTVQFL